MVYYHIARVVEVLRPNQRDVLSADSKTQAVVETWDDNVVTVEVTPKLASKVKSGDLVLLDYNPISQKIIMPRKVIVKIIKGEKARRIWEKYKQFLNRRPRVRPVRKVTPPKSGESITYVG